MIKQLLTHGPHPSVERGWGSDSHQSEELFLLREGGKQVAESPLWEEGAEVSPSMEIRDGAKDHGPFLEARGEKMPRDETGGKCLRWE